MRPARRTRTLTQVTCTESDTMNKGKKCFTCTVRFDTCTVPFYLIHLTELVHRALVLPKQLLGKGYIRWFAIAFPALFVCALSFKMLSVKQGSSKHHFRVFGMMQPGCRTTNHPNSERMFQTITPPSLISLM